tara:strand:- start:42440 stop:42688 length:249 start_codon:yes stop_codon:yes gene_type:complete
MTRDAEGNPATVFGVPKPLFDESRLFLALLLAFSGAAFRLGIGEHRHSVFDVDHHQAIFGELAEQQFLGQLYSKGHLLAGVD